MMSNSGHCSCISARSLLSCGLRSSLPASDIAIEALPVSVCPTSIIWHDEGSEFPLLSCAVLYRYPDIFLGVGRFRGADDTRKTSMVILSRLVVPDSEATPLRVDHGDRCNELLPL